MARMTRTSESSMPADCNKCPSDRPPLGLRATVTRANLVLAGATLADRTRRAIVMQLADGERAVGELAATLPVSQPAVSQHLKVLKDVGLVSERAEGTRRIYRLNEAGVAALRDQLDTFWKRTMSGFEDLMEEDR